MSFIKILSIPPKRRDFFIFGQIKSMMLKLYMLPLIFLSCIANAQHIKFPQSWMGDWKGELHWSKAGNDTVQKVKMELHIKPSPESGKYNWQIIYGDNKADNRPYTLFAKDSAKGHWAIDENNGIILDQFLIADKFCGAFTVQSSTIINNYWLDGDKLIVEFYNLNLKNPFSSGKGTEEIPLVNSYPVRSYQKAILYKE